MQPQRLRIGTRTGLPDNEVRKAQVIETLAMILAGSYKNIVHTAKLTIDFLFDDFPEKQNPPPRTLVMSAV